MDQLDLKGKRILLLYARFFGYDVIVKKKLEEFGAEVDLFDARAEINSFEKALRRINNSYYIKKQKKFHSNIQKEKQHKNYDIIFSNDVLDITIIEKYRAFFPNATLVLYLDDSVTNMKGVETTFHLFDRVLTFDKKDAETYNLHFRPLFFADVYSQLRLVESDSKYDISFVGTCHSDRLRIIKKIQSDNPGMNFYFFCYLQSWFMYYYHYFKEKEYRTTKKDFFKYNPLELKDVARIMKDSKAILDIQHPAQTGLTMRTIETIGLGKKLITTNKDIVNYDFFQETNICVIDRENPIITSMFIDSPYIPIPDEIYERYSLSEWINDIFGSK